MAWVAVVAFEGFGGSGFGIELGFGGGDFGGGGGGGCCAGVGGGGGGAPHRPPLG